MRRLTPEKRNKVFCTAFLAVIFAATYILTSLTPLVADDYNYAFSWADRSRIDKFIIVIKSMITHRRYTHGRVFAQGCVALFMMWPKWIFSIANAGVVTAFFAALHHFFRRSENGNPLQACSAVAALYWVCMPAFGQVFLWLDGACNYFWGAALAWILIELEQSSRKRSQKWIWMIGLLPLAFVAGAWSEHISFAMLVVQFLLICRFWAKEKDFPLFDAMVLLAGVAGYLFLMLAPSMLPSFLSARAVKAIGSHFNTITKSLASHGWILILLLVTAVVIWLCVKKLPNRRIRWAVLSIAACVICAGCSMILSAVVFREKGFYGMVSATQIGFLTLLAGFLYVLGKAFAQDVNKETIVEAVFLSIGGISALVLFTLAMYIPARGFCAPVVFVGIATVKLWTAVELKNSGAIRIALATVFLICFMAGVTDILKVSWAAKEREEAVKQALRTDGVLVAAPYPVKTKYSAQYGLADLENGQSWPNDIIQEFYGLKGIIVISDD